MTKPKKDIKFQHRERRQSRGSMSDSPTEERNGANANGNSKSPTRHANSEKQKGSDAAAGWATDDEKVPVKEQSEFEKKRQTFITRAIWTFVMIGIFFGSMFAGHIYMLIIVTAVQIISYKEVIAIANVPSRARSLRFTKTLNWYFLGSTMYFLYGESVIYYFKHIVLVDKVLLPFATHHRFISFMLYVMGMCLPTGRPSTSLTRCRLRFLCRLPPEGSLQVPIHAVCLDPHGSLPDRCASTLHHEQHL